MSHLTDGRFIRIVQQFYVLFCLKSIVFVSLLSCSEFIFVLILVGSCYGYALSTIEPFD